MPADYAFIYFNRETPSPRYILNGLNANMCEVSKAIKRIIKAGSVKGSPLHHLHFDW